MHARSGDKGGDANLGVWVRDRAAWDWLTSTLTVDELRRLLPETRQLAISRYELPNLGAVNFVLRGLLGTGATSTLRLDAQAKALGEWLRSRSIKVPRASCGGRNRSERVTWAPAPPLRHLRITPVTRVTRPVRRCHDDTHRALE